MGVTKSPQNSQMLLKSVNCNVIKNSQKSWKCYEQLYWKTVAKLFYFGCLKLVIFRMRFIRVDHCAMPAAVTKSTCQFLAAYKAVPDLYCVITRTCKVRRNILGWNTFLELILILTFLHIFYLTPYRRNQIQPGRDWFVV